jgi:hypothetical protein
MSRFNGENMHWQPGLALISGFVILLVLTVLVLPAQAWVPVRPSVSKPDIVFHQANDSSLHITVDATDATPSQLDTITLILNHDPRVSGPLAEEFRKHLAAKDRGN